MGRSSIAIVWEALRLKERLSSGRLFPKASLGSMAYLRWKWFATTGRWLYKGGKVYKNARYVHSGRDCLRSCYS